jgi:hypothetical protein
LPLVIDAGEGRFVMTGVGNYGSFARTDERIHHDRINVDIAKRAKDRSARAASPARPTSAPGTTCAARATCSACTSRSAQRGHFGLP